MKKNKETQAKVYKITFDHNPDYPDTISSEKESLTEIVRDYLEERANNCSSILGLEMGCQITSIEISENCNPNTWNANVLTFNECYGNYIDLTIELL